MGEHYYGPNGEERYDAGMKEVRKEKLLPSVTTILGVINKYGLNKWKEDRIWEKCAVAMESGVTGDIPSLIERLKAELKEEVGRSADHGGRIHRQIERYLKHGEQDEDGFTDKLQAFLQAHDIMPIEIERTFSNRMLGYGGKVDLICDVGGAGSIIDWKTKDTAKNNYTLTDEVPMQLAACATGVELPDYNLYTVIVSRDEPGRIIGPKLWPHNERYYKAFQAAHKLWCAIRNYNPWTGEKWYLEE